MNYSSEFKLTAIKLYAKLKSIRKVAKLLECSKSSLQRCRSCVADRER